MVARLLMLKTLRDIRKLWLQFLSVFFMALLTMLVFVGVTSSSQGMQVSLDDYFAQAGPPDAWVAVQKLSDQELKQVRAIRAVNAAEAGVTVSGRMAGAGDGASSDKGPTVELNAVASSSMPKLDIVSGQAMADVQPQAAEKPGIWLDQDLAQVHGWKLGEQVDFTLGQVSSTYTIQALIHSAEYQYPADPDTSVPDHDRFGFAYTDLASWPQPIYNRIRLRLQVPPDQDGAAFNRSMEDLLHGILGGRLLSYSSLANRPQTGSLQQRIDKVRIISILFSSLFALLAMVTMLTSIARLVGMQETQIATLRALGMSKGLIRLHYASYGLLISALGAVIGLALAPVTVAKIIIGVYSRMCWLPAWRVELLPVSWPVLGALIAACTLVAVLACGRGLRGAPAQMLGSSGAAESSEEPAFGRHHLAGRAAAGSGLMGRLPLGWKWTLRKMDSGKLRTLMGVLGAVGSMVLFCAGFGAESAVQSMPENLYGGQYTYAAKARLEPSSVADPQRSARVRQSVEDAAGARELGDESVQWVQEQAVEYQKDDSQTGSLTVVGPGASLTMKDEQGQRVDLGREVVLTQQAAKSLHIQKGDQISFRTHPGAIYHKLKVSAIAYAPVNQGLVIPQQVWEQELGQAFQPTAALLSRAASASPVSQVEGVFQVTSLKEQKEGLVENISSFAALFVMLKLAALVLGVVVLYNLGVLTYSESERVYATMRVLGCKQREILSAILRENCGVAVVGWFIGIPAGMAFLKLYLGSIASSVMTFSAQLSPSDMVWSSLLTLGSSLAVALIISRRVPRIDMVQALKAGE